MKRPIGVEAHSLIDYAFLAATVGAPLALGLRGPARAVPLAFGATQGMLNALTDQPYAVRRVVPFKVHGRSEAVAVPGLAVAAVETGALGQPRARPYFAALLGLLGTVFVLTDWDATPDA
jgi:hypothetical protein